MTEVSSQFFRMMYKKRPRLFSKASTTNELEKETFGKIRDSYIFTQPGGQTTQYTTHYTTSHEQQIIQIGEENQNNK